MKLIAYLLIPAFIASTTKAVEPLPESDAAFEHRMEWFKQAKFGLFIHYGTYSTLLLLAASSTALPRPRHPWHQTP